MPLNQTPLVLGQQNAPNNSYNVAAPGSSYASTYAGVTTTILVGQSINPDIIHEWNNEYISTLFLMSLARKGRPRKEWNWAAQAFLNAPVEVRAAGAAPVVAAPNGAEIVIPITDLSFRFVSVRDKVMWPDGNAHGIVVAKSAFSTGANTITVRMGQLKAAPAVPGLSLMGNVGPQRGDGNGDIKSVYDPELITYSNIMEDVGKFAVRFDPDEMTELRNTQQVDIIGNKIKTVYDKFMSSIQQRFFMSQYERFLLDDNSTLSTSTRGFLAQQADAGVGVIDVTTSNFTDVLRQAIFDIQLSGSEDLVLAGTGRSLEYAGLGEKSERLRYSVGDKLYDMALTKYNFWGHSVIPMRVDVWEDRGMYGNAMANDLVLFRKSDIDLTYLQNGRPMISRKHTLINQTDNPERASIYDLNLMWYEGLFGVEGRKMAFTRRFRMQP